MIKNCENCKHKKLGADTYPCSECSQKFNDNWELEGCDFCNSKRIIGDGMIEVSVFIDSEDNSHFLEIRTANEMASIKMNYCLFCGREI